MIPNRLARARRLTRCLAAVLLGFAPLAAVATPTVLDWDTLTWVPAGNTNLSETYAIGNGNITVTVSGNTAELDTAGPLVAPDITDQANTGGLVPVQRSFYIATDYSSMVNPQVEVTFDFSGYPGGIGNFTFTLFDVDAAAGFIDTVSATAMTISGPVNPTAINTSVANTQISATTAQGISSAAGTSSDGNVEFVFGDAGTPISGITQVTFVYRNDIGAANPGFQWINIHDFNFDDPGADVSLVKSVVPASASAGQNVTFTIDVNNAGPDAAPGVDVTDLLPAGISYVSDTGAGAYNSGTGVWDVGTVAASGTAQLMITGQVQANGGPWDNSAEVTALLATDADSTPGNGLPAEDDQDNALVLVPIIGTAKAITAGPANNGDGSFSLTYRVTLENFGNDVINGVQVVDDLAATFAGASGFVVDSVTSADFTTNPGYNGNSDTNVLAGVDSLALSASGTVDIAVTVTPGANLGPYNNTATGSGASPGGAPTSDNSVVGNDPDPDANSNPGDNTTPTPVTFTETPQIGVAKAVSSGPVNNGDGTHTLTYRFTLENFGDVPLNSVQVVDNLASTFTGASGFVVDSVTSADFTANPGFDGSGDTNVLAGTDTLAVAATGTVDVTVTVTPGGNLGPYDNSVFAQGVSPGGSNTFDTSVAGTDPDPDGDNDPVNNVGPTPVTFAESPQIGVAKAVSSGPVNNGDGTFTLTYRQTLENFGDVALNSLQVVDNLAATFTGATGFVVDSVTSADFTTNPGFDGSGDTNVLAGTDTLAVAATGTVDVIVTVTPGGNLGPYDNTANASGTSPGAMVVTDDSTSGADPDPDNDGDPGNNMVPTPVSFTEAPQIGAAKAITAGPANNGDGTFTLTYTITLDNSGDVTLSSVQVTDNLATTFTGATGFVVDSVTSADFTPNAGFDGTGDTNVLAGSDTLAVAATGTVDVIVTVTPGGNLGPYDNTANASGTSPGAMVVTDDSTTGADPDPDNDGDPGNNMVPTPVSFTEAPQIGAAKAITAGPANNGDGTFTLTYTITLENSGDVTLSSVQVTDNLATTFTGATGFVVDSVTSADFTPNAGFDGTGDTNVLAGTDTLAVAATGTVDVIVTVTPGGNLGPYDNTANASGTSPGAMVVTDDSTTGADPDPDNDGDPGNNMVPTPVSFTETPQIGAAKAVTAGPANNGDGTFTLTYTIAVENSGDVTLSSVQVTDNLATTFTGATGFVVDSVTSADFTPNAGFDGTGDTNVLAGTDTLAVAATGTVDVIVTVTPGGNLGPYDNTANASGTSPGAMVVTDDSTTGADPDPDNDGDPGNNMVPTPVSFTETPQIGAAKAITAGPANNGDGTFTLTYTITLENSGDVTLSSVQVTDNLATTFTGATGFVVDSVTSADFTPNAGFDGTGDTNVLAGSDTLAVAATGTVDVIVTVTPGGNLGPYDNTANASGTSPGAMVVTDDSTTGADPDPDNDGDPGNNTVPTPVSFMETPEIGAAKAVSSGPASNGDGTFTLTYLVTVENSGDVPLNSVQVVDNLATTFSGATGFVVDSVTSTDFTVNPGFDGTGDTNLLAGTDTLAVAATGTVDVTVTVTPGGNLGPYDNSANAAGTSPGAMMVTDDSTSGVDADPDNDGPGNNSVPTPVNFAEMPQLGVAKAVTTPVNNGDGTFTLTFTALLENTGDVPLGLLQVTDDLATTFAGATGFAVNSTSSADFTVNPAFDGSADTNLLAGTDTLAVSTSGSVAFTVTVTPGGNGGPYDNLATGSGQTPSGTPVSDISTAGADPDPGNDGPADDMTPTTVTFAIGTDATVDITDVSIPGDTLDITVTDADLNTDSGVAETIVVQVVNDTTGEIELVTLTETDVDSGIFGGTVDTVFGTVAGPDNDGVFNTEIGHTVTVTYTDALTSTGGAATLTDTDIVGNTPPTAVDDSSATPIDTPVAVPVLVNDSDPNGHALAIDSVTQPANGAVTFTPDGTVIYTPNPGFTGTDTFTYTISDGNGGFATATVTVTVDDDTPTAVADSAVTPIDTPVVIDVLNNDSDPNNDVLNIVPGSVTDPANGSVVVNADGTVTYTPDPGFTGTDTFTYTITDPDGNTDTAMVTVVVSNDIPQAIDDAETTPLETPVTIVVLGNDSDPNNDPLSITGLTQPANGTAVIDDNATPGDPTDDTIVYTPNAGFTGTDTFTYTITDTDGNSDIATVIVTVLATSTIEGNAWLDADIDDTFDANEQPLEGWTIDVLRNGTVVATASVAADGSYTAAGLAPGSGYSLQLRHPFSTTVFGVIDNITLPPGTTVIDQNLPIDPSGVVYNADTRQPVAGAVVTMSGPLGALPAVCLLPAQQDQVTSADGLYRFDVLVDTDPACPSNATYTIVVTAPAGFVPGVSTLIPPAPTALDATGLPSPFQVAPQPTAPAGGDSTLYYLSFELALGDGDVINNHIPLDPVAAVASLRLTKRADRRTAVAGDLVLYEITVTNDSAGIVTGLTLSDMLPAGFSYVTNSARLDPAAGSTLSVNGQRPVAFAGIRVGANSTTTLRYIARVGAGVLRGDQINTVTPVIGGVPAGNSATATVTITADPDFEETTIVGTVFGDTNGNGLMDPGEAGIPGVRLATVEGLLIETDAFGRYHIAGVGGGFRERGRNFILKVDPASLPDGAQFTTENPRVQRITQGLMSQIDFGIGLAGGSAGCCQQIDVKIAEVFFADGSAEVRPEFMQLLRELAQRLREHGGGTLFVQGNAETDEAAPEDRRAYTLTPHFPVRSAQLQPQDRAELDRIVAQWRGAQHVLIEAVGHTDNTRIAPQNRDEFADNQALSYARAQAVATYVRLALKAAPEQVRVLGRGAAEPVASNDTAAGRAANRRVELSISGEWAAEAAGAGQLARQRAQRVYELLEGLLGDDLMREVDVTTQAAPLTEPQATSATGQWWRRGLGLALGLLVNTAHADATQCTLDDCRTESGYVIEIIEPDPDNAPSPNDSRMALANDSRVDISGRFMVPVAAGGRLWVTEDATAAEPRLAVHAPEVGAAENGRLAVPVSFHIYANYASFITRAEIQIYHGHDIDLIEPLAVLPFRPGVFSRVDWSGDGLSRPVEPGDELYFRVRAYDDKGRYDETHLSHLTLLTRAQYDRVAEREPDKLLPGGAGSGPSARQGPLDGAVLALSPPAERVLRERQSYTLTPHFDTRKADLKAQDRADLERIVNDWRGNVDDVRVHVIGHTDSRPIAPQHRNEFADNQTLSEARARTVVEYLARGLNLDRSHFVSEGRAAREPVDSNTTAAGRAANRRVEVTIDGVREVRKVDVPARADLIEPVTNTTVIVSNTLEEAANLLDARMASGAMDEPAGSRYADPGVAQASSHVLAAVYGQNNLRVQRIPINGSRVRINGQGLSASGLRINGEPVPLDASGHYAVEYLMPVGQHNFDVEVLDERGMTSDRARLPVEVTGRQIFLVALADLTLSDSSVSGNIEQLAADDRYDGDFLVEGRLAFYLKGKIKGKYLVTAQLDSREEQLGDLFGNLLDKDPQSVFRRLDPDRYYPVYGDDSTTVNDIDTQGRFYVRADWDRSSATWGNFHTGLTGNEFAQYNRSLYGAQYQHESIAVTGKGKPKNEGTLFVSEAQTAFGHSEFIGTGGSLYYLKHQDILPGSEKAWIEVRDRDSARVRDNITLVRGIDYEVDEIQGRIILARPLMQITQLQSPGLVKDEPLDGNDMVLLVDYEFLPIGFSPDKVTAGGRGEHWLTDDIKIGATYVDENRAGDDYSLAGGDVLFQPGEGTHVKVEYARSESRQAERFLSLDGGLTFSGNGTGTVSAIPINLPGPVPRDGSAFGIEARVNSREAFDTEREWVGGAWYRDTDAGFSVARRDLGVNTTEFGLEMTGSLSDRTQLSARFSNVEREGLDEDRRLSLQADYRLGDRSTVSGEVRSVDEKTQVSDARGTLLALRYSYDLTTAVEVYGIGQFTLSNDSGRYDNNDLATVGTSIQVGDKTTVLGEFSSGHRGEGAMLMLDHKLDGRHQVYGTFTQSVDDTELRNPGKQLAIGHRSRISNQATLYNERQFVEDRGTAGIAHVFGLDFELGQSWALGLSVQNGELENELGTIDRDTSTVTVDYRGASLKWRGKVEYRNENGLSDLRQVLTTNRLDLKLSDNWRLLARLNHAETQDQTLTDRDDNALFTEAGFGFAYRPVDGGRLNMLAKYTFLYDLPAPLQVNGGTDQRSHVLSLEGIYRLAPKWELGGKLARRHGELRIDRDFGEWFESSTTFLALRGRYHLIRRWDAMLELRSLDVDEADSTRNGWLVAVDRHFNDHLRLGLGYNFTDFSDDLTNLDYDHKGWFVNAIGKY